MFYLALATGETRRIISGFESQDDAYLFLVNSVRRTIADSDDDADDIAEHLAATDDEVVTRFFDRHDNSYWFITDRLDHYTELTE